VTILGHLYVRRSKGWGASDVSFLVET